VSNLNSELIIQYSCNL